MKKRKYRQAGIATAQQPAKQTVLNHLEGRPTRYYFEPKKLKSGRMSRKKYFVAVEFGDPRYDKAPYEMEVKWL